MYTHVRYFQYGSKACASPWCLQKPQTKRKDSKRKCNRTKRQWKKSRCRKASAKAEQMTKAIKKHSKGMQRSNYQGAVNQTQSQKATKLHKRDRSCSSGSKIQSPEKAKRLNRNPKGEAKRSKRQKPTSQMLRGTSSLQHTATVELLQQFHEPGTFAPHSQQSLAAEPQYGPCLISRGQLRRLLASSPSPSLPSLSLCFLPAALHQSNAWRATYLNVPSSTITSGNFCRSSAYGPLRAKSNDWNAKPPWP